ncbi:uncharacterized protein CLUP02_16733 [Colletotrichum lupini]|uniref:Uncharacterized protein n=1 Tax=Colletotrichum lupini TaxID=145971 RepID=A0A9Q8T8D5_9PEZI|nr:uncharacterized protein CLUP02_16733 [Colletotrichum lupini]UQC91199.1 hypothetical protein CLUP02_16733 [Colletotrichum lupini]
MVYRLHLTWKQMRLCIRDLLSVILFPEHRHVIRQSFELRHSRDTGTKHPSNEGPRQPRLTQCSTIENLDTSKISMIQYAKVYLANFWFGAIDYFSEEDFSDDKSTPNIPPPSRAPNFAGPKLNREPSVEETAAGAAASSCPLGTTLRPRFSKTAAVPSLDDFHKALLLVLACVSSHSLKEVTRPQVEMSPIMYKAGCSLSEMPPKNHKNKRVHPPGGELGATSLAHMLGLEHGTSSPSPIRLFVDFNHSTNQPMEGADDEVSGGNLEGAITTIKVVPSA